MGSAALAPVASAGQLHVFQCQTPSGRNVPLENLDLDNGGLAFIGADNTCGTNDGVVGLWLGSLGRSAGQRVRATLNAPYYGSFQSVSVGRRARLAGGAGAGDTASPYWAQFKDQPILGDGSTLEFCAWYAGCADRNWNGTPGTTTHAFPQGANKVIWEVGCGGSTGGGCDPGANGESRAIGVVTAVHMVISESGQPLGTVSGPATQTTTVHRGTESVTVDASDYGTGVFEVRVKLDDTVVARQGVGGTCSDQGNSGDLDFERLFPCPTTKRFELPVDTTKVADGRRTLQVVVTDAAGNETSLPGVGIDVDNVPPPKALKTPVVSSPVGQLTDLRPGDGLLVSDGTWEGANLRFSYQWQRSGEGGYSDIPDARLPRYTLTDADVGHQVRVSVTATNAEGTTVAQSNATGVVKSGASVRPQSLAPTSTTTKVEGSPQLVVDREQRSVQVSRNAKIVVTGRLVDADAQPIADAEVEVFEQVAVVGSPWQRVAVVRTDGQGGYAYRPTTTGSRTLRFAYAARRDSGDYRATREVVISVLADMRLRAVPRTVKRGGMFKLRGRVMVDPLPSSGTWVEVQVLDAGVWRTVGTRRTSANGRWSWRHRVQRVSGVTFTFRARLRPTSDVPAAESKSAPVKVRVR